MHNYYIYIRIIFNVLDKLAFVLHLHSHDASVAVFFATVFHWCSYWFNEAFRTQSQLAFRTNFVHGSKNRIETFAFDSHISLQCKFNRYYQY